MSKLKNEKIIKVFESVKDGEAKKVLLHDGFSLCSVKFIREHEKAFRTLMPKYFDKYMELYDGYRGDNVYADRETFMAYMCLQLGIVDGADFRTVVNFVSAGIDTDWLDSHAPSSDKLFRDGVRKMKDGDKKLLEFLDEKPEYLDYFLPLMCSLDNGLFSSALSERLKSAGLQDSMRIRLLKAMMHSSDANMLLRALAEIDDNNYYRFKALNEAAVLMGDYTVLLPPKELVPVLRDAAYGNCGKYFGADFRHAYHFINTYDRVHSESFKEFALKLLERGDSRARQALLYSLSADSINTDYAKSVFSCSLTLEELSLFVHRVSTKKMDPSDYPIVFECLFGLLESMDKVNYHYKTDDDITFARDISKSDIVSKLGDIAEKSDGGGYAARLDGIYDTLKEEAQAAYLRAVGRKTKLDTRLCAVKFLKTDNYYAVAYYDEKNIKLGYDEAVLVSDFLKTKKERIKSKIIKEYLRSKDCDKIIKYLLSSGEDYKKAAGEELKKSRGKTDPALLSKKTERFYWHSESVFKAEKPSEEIKKLASRKSKVKQIKIPSHKQVKEFFVSFDAFLREHADYEYAANYEEGLVQFGACFSRVKGSEYGDNSFGAYPLGAEIKEFISAYPQEFIAGNVALVHCVEHSCKNLYASMGGNFLGDAEKSYEYVDAMAEGKRYFDTNGYTVLRSLLQAMVKELLDERTQLSLLAAFAGERALAACTSGAYPWWICNILTENCGGKITEELVRFECLFIEAKLTESFSSELTAVSYEEGIISDELARYFVLKTGLYNAFSPKSTQYVFRSDYKFPKFKTLVTDFAESALEAEFNRGSLQTPYSEILCRTGRFYGAEKFFKAIVALRGLTLVRSPYGYEKNEVLSVILKNTVKGENDTYETFAELINKYSITEGELMRATLFNPEFADFTARYIGVPDLKLAVFWFIAHLNESLYGEKEERRIEQIKEFSDIDYSDFKDGAFDYKWYEEMTRKVPANVLKRVYDDAKYVTVGGLHKRAQRFFDAVNGKIAKSECIEKMNSTRNKDYCLIYSLIPVESREDLYERYAVLAEFARGSKQFGAQRQLSERRTVDIALENLARAAGYESPDIFMFEMESETPSDIYKSFAVGDITVEPYIDDKKFKISYRVQKDGKTLSAIPSKYSKDKTVTELRERIKSLNQKFRRIIASFENAMNAQTEFTAEQLGRMCRERIIQTVLSKLLLIGENGLCVYDGGLKSLDGAPLSVSAVRVAHAVELKKLSLLSEAIKYVAANNIRQPFKQALREIYSKTDIELTQDEVLRFKGYEVDLKKCVAALKGRGWGVSEDIGLRKVYYRTDTVAAIFRECDFLYTVDFENVNRELHGIFFLKRKSGEIMPIKDVDDVTFSETLRDVDLMISISSKVIYDFELAMSTVEVRHEVLKSIVEILGLKNVSFLKDNIKVEGTFGTYTVNIRTGLVFKEGSGNLALETVYSIDKPILLDFADEDPMTADIISKAVVLSADANIKDPAILREIK